METYEANWKNYYQILKVSPDAELKVITASYKRLVHLYHKSHSDRGKNSQDVSTEITGLTEAYEVLADPDRRAVYDRMFEAKYGSKKVVVEESTKDDIIDLMELVVQDVSKSKIKKGRRVLVLSRRAQRVLILAIASCLIIITGGSSYALAQPESTLAAPFKGVAIAAAKTSSGAISLVEDVRSVVAIYERNIVSTSIQSMRVLEGISEVTPVTVPTNDMARFPSPEHPLYPEYLDKRKSQFKYIVDSSGIVTVDTSGATTNALHNRIERLLNSLAGKE